jgi:hypothetical protein
MQTRLATETQKIAEMDVVKIPVENADEISNLCEETTKLRAILGAS